MTPKTLYTERVFTSQLHDFLGKEVKLFGWIHVRRDQGKLIFLEIRDKDGIVQGVVLPNRTDVLEIASKLRSEYVVAITGLVNGRPERNIQKDSINGDIEIEITGIEIINASETMPYDIHDSKEVGEDVRLKYRYLDLRGKRVHDNIVMRDKIIMFFREYMHANGFIEIETPMLMRGTPEGSREYLVPSRLHHGTFYALPQSPQQFKQLLMVAGFERYFQIARCMRDEDQRGDRQPEFTQLDFEMSFIDQETILQYTEKMFIEMVQKLYPNKKLTTVPFPRLTYAESMEKYGSDKPDLRNNKEDPDELAFAWIVDFPMYEEGKDGKLTTAHHPFCSMHPEDVDTFMNAKPGDKELLNVRANSYDLVLNGFELSSGSIRIHQKEIQKKVFELLGMSEEQIQSKFGHMLEAFTFGTPPHGGFAPGIDRIVMLMQNEPNIREVIAFPKTGEGRDLMTGAPAPMPVEQLTELGVKIIKE
ncbi:MAG: hypothetical protein RJB39_351 [Candidatus Parcubacteria bacterium]|jgi:aspartyl-tRNA synthetase